MTTQPEPCRDRGAARYDRVDGVLERWMLRRWRERLWALVPAGRILEVGVGTGANLRHYPPGSRVTAIDRSVSMLDCSRQRARERGVEVELRAMDAQALDFPADTFDSVVATLVFCSVPDPVAGLSEVRRVLKPDGRAYLLEHVRADVEWLGKAMDGIDLALARFTDERFARRTVENVRRAGLRIEAMQRLTRAGVVRLMVARRL